MCWVRKKRYIGNKKKDKSGAGMRLPFNTIKNGRRKKKIGYWGYEKTPSYKITGNS